MYARWRWTCGVLVRSILSLSKQLKLQYLFFYSVYRCTDLARSEKVGCRTSFGQTRPRKCNDHHRWIRSADNALTRYYPSYSYCLHAAAIYSVFTIILIGSASYQSALMYAVLNPVGSSCDLVKQWKLTTIADAQYHRKYRLIWFDATYPDASFHLQGVVVSAYFTDRRRILTRSLY